MSKTESRGLKFLDLSEVQNPRRLSENSHGGRLSAENRLFHLNRQLDGAAVLAIYESHVLVDSGSDYALVAYSGTGQALRTKDEAEIIPAGEAADLVRELAEHEHARFLPLTLTEEGRRHSAADERRITDLINLGMDLLGPDRSASMLSVRRESQKVRVPTPGFSISSKKESRPLPPKYASATRMEGALVVPSTSSLQPPKVLDASTAAEEVAKVLAGAGAIDIVTLKEDRYEEITDALFELANQLDMIATTRLVLDKDETLAVLDRAAQAIDDAKVVKYVQDDSYPDGQREVILTPEQFMGWGMKELRARIEGALGDWFMIPERDARDLGLQADNLRRWLKSRSTSYAMPEHLGDASREIQDLMGGDIAENRAAIRTLMKKRIAEARADAERMILGEVEARGNRPGKERSYGFISPERDPEQGWGGNADQRTEAVGEDGVPIKKGGKKKKPPKDMSAPDDSEIQGEAAQIPVQAKIIATAIRKKTTAILAKAKAVAEHNDCHGDQDGKFCSTGGGGSKSDAAPAAGRPSFDSLSAEQKAALAAKGKAREAKNKAAKDRRWEKKKTGLANWAQQSAAASKADAIAAHRSKDAQKSDRFQKWRQKVHKATARVAGALDAANARKDAFKRAAEHKKRFPWS